MARTAQVRYFESRHAYYCQLKGKQECLAKGPDDKPNGPTYTAAVRRYAHLVTADTVGEAGDRNTVRVIANQYLDWLASRRQPATLALRRRYLAALVALWGDEAIGLLKPWHLDKVVTANTQPGRDCHDKPTGWGPASVIAFGASCSACWRWAVKQGLITRVPVPGYAPAGHRSRSRERIVTPEEHTTILTHLRKPRQQALRNLIVALEGTGARPGELRNAKVADWHDALGAIVYYPDDVRREDEYRHKTAGKGKTRTIRFHGEALAMVRSLIAGKARSAHIFLNKKGVPYTKGTVTSCFQRLRDTFGYPHLVAYAYRHTFATRWLSSGGSVDVLAELLGNTPATIRSHYSHLCGQHERIRQQLDAFMKTNPHQ